MSRILSPDEAGHVLLVGLTGGIATGKSSVSGMLRAVDVVVVDADEIVHRLLEPGGAAVAAIAEAFGDEVLDERGGVDRPRLAARVFEDEQARRELERRVHPLVIDESRRRILEAASRPGADIVIYDAPLLIETNRHREFDRLVVVHTPERIQLERLMERDGLDADAAGARIRSQLPIDAKAELADYIIDNGGPWHETRKQVAELRERLTEDVAALRAGRPLAVRRRRPF